jgi:hypothetical protein
LGQRDQAGAQRDAGHEYRQQHQQHKRPQHQYDRNCFDL